MGFFIMLQFAGGGINSLNFRAPIHSFALFPLGFLPPVISIFFRLKIFPKTETHPTFMSQFVISLALCEMVGVLAMFVFPPQFVAERTLAIIGSFIGITLLCPLKINIPTKD